VHYQVFVCVYVYMCVFVQLPHFFVVVVRSPVCMKIVPCIAVSIFIRIYVTKFTRLPCLHHPPVSVNAVNVFTDTGCLKYAEFL